MKQLQSSESLEATEKECAEGRAAPRVSLSDIENNIAAIYYRTGLEAVESLEPTSLEETRESLSVLTLAIVVFRNGYTFIGKSAPASAANFDADLGKKLAYEDAIRHAWPMLGFALKDRMYRDRDKQPGE